MKRPCSLAALALVTLGLAAGCRASSDNDQPLDAGPPDPLGNGARIKQITDPTLPNHPANNAPVSITGATFLWVDTFDETNNGKSKGDVFFQDVGSSQPFSGISVYEETYEPADLKPAPGDVLDLKGTYQESPSVGAAVFTAPDVLVQIAKPIVVPRFEYSLPAPTPIDPNDLNAFESGRQWMSMLVTVSNVTFSGDPVNDGSGRVTAPITSTTGANAVTMSNELFDTATWNATAQVVGKGKTVKSITGIVTWFYSYHIAPRTPDDIVVQ